MIPYAKLRGELLTREINHEEFAKDIGLSRSALSQRLNAHREWTLDEVYRVMDFLGLPYTAIPDYFPKDGRGTPMKERTPRFLDITNERQNIAQ